MTALVASRRRTVARFVAGYAVVAAALPYLVLKLAWLTGHPIGLADPGLVHDSGLWALNLVTAAMDAVAVLVALTFTHRWGVRAPAWLVLLPMWVGTGLLAPIAVVGPFAAAYLALSGRPVVVGGPVRPWVYGMVYTGFVCEGLALMTAFVLYARTRWPALLRTRAGDGGPGATHRLQVVVARGAMVLAALVGAVELGWALGLTAGLPARVLVDRDVVGRVVEGLSGVLALAAGLGLLMLVRQVGAGVRLWVPVTLAWVGAGSMFAWGAWTMVVALSGSVLAGNTEAMAAVNLVALGKLVGGLLIGTVAAFTLAERDAVRA